MLALERMIFSDEEIELQHLYCIPEESAHRHEISPLAMQVHVGEIHDAVHDEHPHHREVPVTSATQPATEGEIRGNSPAFERITAERRAAPCEAWICIENAQSAADHDRQCNRVHPVRNPYNPVMSGFTHESSEG